MCNERWRVCRSGVALGWIAVALLASCKRDTPARPLDAGAAPSSARANKTPPAATLEETRARVEKLHNETLIERAKLVTTAKNLASYASSRRRYEREADMVRLFDRVPMSPKPEDARASIETALGSLSLKLQRWSATPRVTKRRTLPATLPEGPRFDPLPDDFRGVLGVRFEIPNVGPDRAEAVLKKLGGMLRLFYTTRIQAGATGLEVEGEAYWYHQDFRVPRMVARERSLERDLAERGIDPMKVQGDPTSSKRLDELAADYKEMAAHAADYAKAMDAQSDLIRFGVWSKFARERAGEAADRSVGEVLVAPKP